VTVRRVLPVGDVSRARTKPPVPPSAAWEIGDPVAGRRFAQIGDLPLEGYRHSVAISSVLGSPSEPITNTAIAPTYQHSSTGNIPPASELSGSRTNNPTRLLRNGALPHVTMAYEAWGTLNEAQDNAVLILHALTGDAHVTGGKAPGQLAAGWWSELVGPGRPIDTNKNFVVAPNVLGGCSGSTGPASRSPRGTRWGGNFPRLTIRDQVNAEIRLAQHLGIVRWRLVLGASMGGLRALEWSLLGPENGIEVDGLCAIATTAATSADQIAWAHPQLAAIRLDPGYHGGNYYDLYDDAGPHQGLAIARQIAHTTYRSASELDTRFQRFPQSGEDPFVDGRYAIQSYLDHHGDKLARRFDANTYLVLTEAMFTHDLGRDRGGTDAALASITAKTLVVAVDSDRLYPVAQSARIASQVPMCELAIINSAHGHDGFLIEFAQLEPVIRNFLTQLDPAATEPSPPAIGLVA